MKVQAKNSQSIGAIIEVAGATLSPGLPGPPAGLCVAAFTGGTATLSWSAPSDGGGVPAQRYQVSVQSTGSGSAGAGRITVPYNTTIAGSSRQYTFIGLLASTKYCADVAVVTAIGVGTSGVCFTTAPPSAPSAVVQLQVLSVMSGAATISWVAPVDNGGAPIESYHVQIATKSSYTQVGTGALAMKPAVLAPPTTIYGLLAGTPYVVVVAASNAVAGGEITQISVTTANVSTAHAPQAAFVLVSDTGLATVHWQPPQDDGSSLITSFVVRSSDSVRGNITRVLEGTATSFEDTPSSSVVRVWYAVWAVTRVGSGTSSPDVEAVFAHDAAGIPVLRVSRFSSSSATLSWTIPPAPPATYSTLKGFKFHSNVGYFYGYLRASEPRSLVLLGLPPSSLVNAYIQCAYLEGDYFWSKSPSFTTAADDSHAVYADSAGTVTTGAYADSSTSVHKFMPAIIGISGIVFSFSSFDVECDNDYVAIYDAARPASPVFKGGCKRDPFSVTVASTTYVVLQITSDASVHRDGLVFNYTALPSTVPVRGDIPAGESAAPVVAGLLCSGAGVPVLSGACICNPSAVGEACAAPSVACPGSPLCRGNSSIVVVVSMAGDDAGNGSFPTKPLATLNKAFSVAPSGATVAVVSCVTAHASCA